MLACDIQNLRKISMDFSLTNEQIKLTLAAKEFAQSELGTDIMSKEKRGAVEKSDWIDDWRKCAEFGVLKLNVPTQYGGQGLDTMTTVLVLEALGYGCSDHGLTLGLNGQLWAVQEPILSFGSEQQKSQYLPEMCRGEIIGAHGMTEPGNGSDAFSMTTQAEKCPGGYILNGHKTFIGLGPACDMAIVFAVTDPDAGQWGISAFLVDASTPGFVRSEPQQKMGLRTTPMGELILENCRVDESTLLGTEGAGVSIFQSTMLWERSFIFASHVGSMHRQLDECVAYAKERKAFGQTIGSFQSVSNRIANMKVRLDTSQLLMYRCAQLMDTGKCSAVDASMAKLHISEAFVESSLDAIRTFGGRGYLSETGVERDLRDAIGGVLYSGTSDIQRQVIARLMGV